MSFNTMARNVKFIGLASVKNAFSNNNGFLKQIQISGFDQIQSRSFAVHELARNVNYLTNDKKSVKVNSKTMKLERPIEKPLCVMLVWLGSKEKNIMKYGSIYLDQGYDILTARIPIKDAFYPVPNVMITAGNVLKFMEENLTTQHPTVISAFSIGTFIYSEIMAHVSKDVERYKPTLEKINVQIWDSFVDASDLQYGVSKAIFPHNAIMQNLTSSYIGYHLKKNVVEAEAYKNASVRMHTNYCKSPVLHFCSKTDQVGLYKANLAYSASWRKLGVPIYTKCWEDSPHVQHYQYHPIEYLTELYNFLESNNLLFKPELLRQKIDVHMDKLRSKAKIIPTNA